MKFKILIICLLSLTVLIGPGNTADVLFFGASHSSSSLERQVELGCRFYGLNMESLYLEGNEDIHQIVDALKRGNPIAIVIAGCALESIANQKVLSALQNDFRDRIPILVMGVTSMCNKEVLKRWSDGTILESKKYDTILSQGTIRVADLPHISRELSGQSIPFKKVQGYHLIVDEKKQPQVILKINDEQNGAHLNYFVKTSVAKKEVFFQTEMQIFNEPVGRYHGFFEIAPLLMFLRYSGGERCWHTIHDYANLTIDDPWLTEPYGHLNYTSLLGEMEKTNFHTTISFIPWNYDRSEPDVVSLFREHHDKLSICIHGNNHDHYEFFRYESKPGDPWPAKPLNIQEANIKQAVARMEKFNSLTGLSYERVMVFPHGIAPAKTLGLLKKYNFLGTVNGGNRGNVPLGTEKPSDPLYFLRPTTLEFQNFPSLIRYSPKKRSQSDIAIDLFLDNPILFYEHHSFFKNGVDLFNRTAVAVNDIQPNVVWQSLGHILQHLYLKKLRDDGNYDILVFSNNFILENTDEHDVTFFVQKEESFFPPIERLTVDSQPYPYDGHENLLILKIVIPAGASRHVVIEYENELEIAAIDISKNDRRINLLRKLSDVRDMTLSRNLVGRTLIHFYYDTGLFKLGLKRLAVILVFSIIIFGSGILYLRTRSKKN